MQNKLDKYGLKFWVIVENDSKFVIAIQPYLGKDETVNPTGKLSTRMAQSLHKSAGLGPGYNIMADDWFLLKICFIGAA